jgi:cellulose synthase/poly-beta-1,6-N-acetylglucosamine synthase-like glycosyltransferase
MSEAIDPMVSLTTPPRRAKEILGEPVVRSDSRHLRLPPSVYVIVPALNEEKSIGEVILQTQQALAGFESEIVVVDGSSIEYSARTYSGIL